MKRVLSIAIAATLAGCINLGDKGVYVIKERTVNITGTGFEDLPVGRYRFMLRRNDLALDEAWNYGFLIISEHRKYVLDPSIEGKEDK